ncbi:MAG: hypothetical protein K6G91_13965 [Kiritimatiellae bacterium]|nr:hypothetical protein [Kiritimatiellia bacterium]
MKTVFRKVLAVASALLLFDCVASESTNSVSEADLWVFFKSIEREGTNFVLTARRSFLYSIDEKNPGDNKFSKAGERIILPEGSELVAVERHHSLKFTPMSMKDGRKGLRVFRRGWSPRKGVTTRAANMVHADEKSDSSGEGEDKVIAASGGNRAIVKSAGAPEKGTETKKCLKGLVLLPCEEQGQ